MAFLVGKWKLVDSENFEEFMKAAGVGLATRKIGASVKPNQEISVDGDHIVIKTISTFKNTTIKFKLGEEFEQTTADGEEMKSVITQEGDNKLVEIAKGKSERKIIRELIGDEYVMTLETNGVTAKRRYTRDA